MKRFGLIWVLWAVLLTGCGKHASVKTPPGAQLSPQLLAIDTLIQTRPDSALTLLLDAPMDDPYYQLLLSETLYKNDSTQANRSELLEAMAYFDSVDDAFLSARCHYMNGVGYYEMDSVVPACAEYLKALEIMEDHFEEKELVGYKAKFMALTYTHLCGLFSDQYLHEQAIYFGKQSLSYYNRFDAEPWHVAWILEIIGTHYDMKQELDSANYYYNLAQKTLPDSNSLIYRDIVSHCAYLLYKTSQSTEIPLSQLYLLYNQSESEEERLARCLTIGEVFYHQHLFDSALYYLDCVFEMASNNESKLQAAQWILEIHNQPGDTVSTNEYVMFLSQFANIGDQYGKVNSTLTELYRRHESGRIDKIQQSKAKKRQTRFLIIFGILVTVLSLGIVSNRTWHKKLQNFLETKHAEVLKKEKKRSAQLLKENEALKEERNGLLLNIEKQPRKNYEELMRETICLSLRQRFWGQDLLTTNNVSEYSNLAITTKQERLFVETIEKHCPGFTSKLTSHYPKLNHQDVMFCRLILIGLTEINISVLKQMHYSNVWRRAKKIKETMGVVDLESFLIDLFFCSEND